MALDDLAGAEQAVDARSGVKRAEHQGQPAVLLDVGDGLVARAGGIDVGDLIGRQDAERGGGDALGREVDVFAAQGSRGDEEDGLLHQPFLVVFADGGIKLDHFDIYLVEGEQGETNDIYILLLLFVGSKKG